MNTLVSLITGIMAFVSGLFGHQIQETIPTPTPVANEQVTSTSSAQSQAASSANTLITYRDENYGFELQYSKPIYLDNCLDAAICLGMSRFEEDEMGLIVLGITVRNYTSLDAWYSQYAKESKNSTEFNDTTIDNLPAKKILRQIEIYGKGTSCQLTGVLYQERIFEICDGLNNKVSKDIIESIKFPTVSPSLNIEQARGTSSTQTQATNTSEGYDLYDRPDPRVNKEVILVSNDPYATIARDFEPVFIYTTKNKRKIYFTELSERDGSPACVNLYYFDIIKKMYNEIKNGYCPRSLNSISPSYDPKKNLPLHIQEGDFNFRDTYNQEGILNNKNNDLYVLNLETGTKTLLYTNTNPNESLIAGCYYIPETYEFLGYLPYIEYTNTNHVKIGVYKNVGQNSKPCKYDGKSGYSTFVKIEVYEKIRDDIVDLTKIP